ncbi:uncharacterized protein LOC112494081 [Cephus cinctus]|uniref:Uncharacterized protein LOC112494081 n=1 Tax=Cephus cinctus TaxID=211228 RepID=A0AAJ7VZH8_CEPCN|nr:uncharacterized protein LOC112494081 [Cephus cinctus]
MIDTPSNPDVISSRTWTATFISLIALLSHGSYVQAATNRHVRDNVVYGSSDLVTSGTLKDVGKSKETDRVTAHLHSAGANDVSVQDNHDDNSPALNSFLENVLKAQNELKWIDQAVRRVDVGEKRFDRFQSGSDRFGRMSDLNSKDIYQTRIRVKRDLDQAKGPDASWVPEKKKYENDYRGFPERTYLDDELKFKRDVDPDDFQEDTVNLLWRWL